MKAPIIAILILAMLSVIDLNAQSFYSSQYRDQESFSIALENNNTRSIRGWKTGVALSFQWKEKWYADFVYLTSLSRNELPSDQFSGLQLSYLFNITKSVRLGPAIRVGLYNNQFFHLLPSAKAQVELTPRIYTEAAYAHSDGFPFFEMNIGYKLFRK